jgi:septal ring factor EnvC (AmiA/AmiB activator)
MKNPFTLLAANIQNKIKAALIAMQAKFRSESNNIRGELLACKNELKQIKNQLVISEDKNTYLQEENDTLNNRLADVKKSFFFLQTTSDNALKVQKLVDAYKRIKIELLGLRKTCDCSVIGSERLQQEIKRNTILSESMSNNCGPDINSLLGTIEILKKDLSKCKHKNDNLERLVLSIKKHERKLINHIKSKQVL